MPVPGNPFRGLPVFHRDTAVIDILLHYRPEGVINAGFVIQKVESDVSYIFGVQCLLIYFRYEEQVRPVFLDFLYQPFEKCRRNQFHHIATESVNPLLCPEIDDVIHLLPGFSMEIAVVQFDRVIPVINAW